MNPIDAGGQSLSTLPTGAGGVVCSLLGGHAFRSRIANLGFTAGAEVTVVQNYGRGPMIVAVRGTRVALGRIEAQQVLVQSGVPGAGNAYRGGSSG